MPAPGRVKIDPALYCHAGQVAVPINRKKRESLQRTFCIKGYTCIGLDLMRLNRYSLYQRNHLSLCFPKSNSDNKGKCASFSDKTGCPI